MKNFFKTLILTICLFAAFIGTLAARDDFPKKYETRIELGKYCMDRFGKDLFKFLEAEVNGDEKYYNEAKDEETELTKKKCT